MTSFDAVWQSLERSVADGYAPGIVAGVRHRGNTEFFATGRFAFEPDSAAMTPDTPFRVASVGKLVAGALSTMLLDEGVLELDAPIDLWLPEFAAPRVLVRPDAPLDETIAADRSITVRDLLTMTAGFAFPMPETPLTRAMAEAGVASGYVPAQVDPDAFAAHLGALPLAHQPGSRFVYDTAADVLSILLARASGVSLGELVRTRVAEPLGLTGTGFAVEAATDALGESLPTPYRATDDDTLEVYAPLVGVFEQPPHFESLRGGLVSTVPDILRFLAAIADDELLTRDQRMRMTGDQLTDDQRQGLTEMGDEGHGWGFQAGVDLLPDAIREEALAKEPWRAAGRWGWTGGTGTSAYVDPSRDLIGVVFTQHLIAAPTDDFAYFWRPLVASVDG
jgi:CubicO group peptidase (beta-lactamase class C family)